MRILIVTDQFPPQFFGGMAQHAWHIAHHLSKRHTVHVLTPRSHGTPGEWRDLPFSVSAILSIRYPVLDVAAILRSAHTFGADVIHVCNAGLSYRPVTRRYPTVTRVVGNDFIRPWVGYWLPFRSGLYRIPGNVSRARIKSFETRIRSKKAIRRLQQVDAVVANSDWTCGQLIEMGVEEHRIRTIVGGVDTSVFQPAQLPAEVRFTLNIAQDALVLLTAAKLMRKKGIDTVLNAVARLADQWPELRYIVVGDGPERPYLLKLADDLCLRKHVIFAGRKSQSDLMNYYQASDVFVQVSRNDRLIGGYLDVETMGRTYMEAGACGIPVIAGRVGGVSSVVHDNVNGVLVNDLEDYNAIASAINKLLHDADLRYQMGQSGLKLARENWSWEQVTAAFEAVMIQAVHARAR